MPAMDEAVIVAPAVDGTTRDATPACRGDARPCDGRPPDSARQRPRSRRVGGRDSARGRADAGDRPSHRPAPGRSGRGRPDPGVPDLGIRMASGTAAGGPPGGEDTRAKSGGQDR
jgi:hypothetical protein